MQLPTIEQIENTESTSDLYNLIEGACSDYVKNSDSWSDSAAKAENNDQPEVARILRIAEKRWFELEQ